MNRMLATLAAVGLLLSGTPATAQVPQLHPGVTYWGQHQYVEYLPGTAPIVISAGHGGFLKPPSIPNRAYGVSTQDLRTQEQARALSRAIVAAVGRAPHVVISHLHRSKLDPNREIVEAAQGDPVAEQAWHDFHGFIEDASSAVLAQYGRGLYIDVHGHAHPEGWIELGYALSASDLMNPDPVLNQALYIDASTIRSLASLPGVVFSEVLRGPTSLGGLLETAGHTCVPSPGNPDPAGGNYFSGGYGVRRHGSRVGGTVDGVQIELPLSIRETASARRGFAQSLAGGLETLFTMHYGSSLIHDPVVTIGAADRFASETGGTGRLVINRTGSLANPLPLSIAVEGTATSGTDYLPIPTGVNLLPGQSEAFLDVQPVDDPNAEGEETVTVVLRGNAEIGAANRATVVILDDENDAGLLAHLPFDETGTTAFDITGNGHHGSLVPPGPGAPLRVPGQAGGGLEFTGAAEHVAIPDFDYGSGGAGSVTFWFKVAPQSGNAYRYAYSHGAVGQPHSLNVYISEADGTLRTALAYANDLSASSALDVTDDFRDGQWHHYALTTAIGALSRVYVDGQPAAEAFLAGDALDPAGDVVLGGRSDLSATRFLIGSLDEVRWYARALHPLEIAALVDGLGPDAAVYPGTAEDLALFSGPGGFLTSGPPNDVKTPAAGTSLTLEIRSPGGAFIGAQAVIATQLFPTGSPPLLPGNETIHLNPPDVFILSGPTSLTANGLAISATVPGPGLLGVSAMVQGFAVSPAAGNGVLAATDAHEIRFAQ